MKKKDKLSSILNISFLAIALVSLVISVVALKIAQKTLDLSSISYIPQFEFSFKENDEIQIINPNDDLFKVDFINLIEIKTIGIEHYALNGFIEIPFITKSVVIRNFNNNKFKRTINIKPNFNGPCAYFCACDETILKTFEDKAKKEFSIDSKKGYMLPSLQSKTLFIEIYYSNKNKERKSIILKRTFIHGGGGYDETIISSEALDSILNNAVHPKFENVGDFEKYAFKKYYKSFN